MKKRVTGVGGIFFKAKDAKALTDWYDKHLHISPLPHSPWGEDDDAPLFEWRDKDDPERKCYTVFAAFPEATNEFESDFMFNFRVDDLDSVLAQLAEEGIHIEGEIREYPYGRFAYIRDPEGNRIDLWQPAKGF